MRFLILLLLALPVYAQDQSLPDVGYELPGGVLRLAGAKHNLDIRLGRCAGMRAYSEAQIGKQIKCRLKSWEGYYSDVGMRPCKPVRKGAFVICE